MFNPILITTPRTGSTFVCQLLGRIARHTSDYKNDLQEYYTIEPKFKSVYETATVFTEEIIVIKTYEEVPSTPLWFASEANIPQMHLKRTEMLNNNKHRYMLKLFPNLLRVDHIRNAIFPKYTPIFLERKDVQSQFFSWLYLSTKDSKFHYRPGQTAAYHPLKFTYEAFSEFKNTLLEYKRAKFAYPGPTLCYEHILEQGGDTKAIASLLNISLSNFEHSVVNTIKTPYSAPINEMLVQDSTWIKHKNEVEDFFSFITTV